MLNHSPFRFPSKVYQDTVARNPRSNSHLLVSTWVCAAKEHLEYPRIIAPPFSNFPVRAGYFGTTPHLRICHLLVSSCSFWVHQPTCDGFFFGTRTTPPANSWGSPFQAALHPYLPEAGGMPILTIDGKAFAQSRAILRYVGRIAKYEGELLYPTDPMEPCTVACLSFCVFFGCCDQGTGASSFLSVCFGVLIQLFFV